AHLGAVSLPAPDLRARARRPRRKVPAGDRRAGRSHPLPKGSARVRKGAVPADRKEGRVSGHRRHGPLRGCAGEDRVEPRGHLPPSGKGEGRLTKSAYAASFLEGSLGLVSGSLSPDAVPADFVDELTSVMRGAPPKDPTAPSLEAKTLKFLVELERSSLEEKDFFVRKARWP